jgi:hypothetical protein
MIVVKIVPHFQASPTRRGTAGRCSSRSTTSCFPGFPRATTSRRSISLTSGNARLTPSQQSIKNAVKTGLVKFGEVGPIDGKRDREHLQWPRRAPRRVPLLRRSEARPYYVGRSRRPIWIGSEPRSAGPSASKRSWRDRKRSQLRQAARAGVPLPSDCGARSTGCSAALVDGMSQRRLKSIHLLAKTPESKPAERQHGRSGTRMRSIN